METMTLTKNIFLSRYDIIVLQTLKTVNLNGGQTVCSSYTGKL